MLRWIAHLCIAIGSIGWVITIFLMDGDPGKQMLAAGVMVIGVFLHHVWDEIYRDKDA